MLKLLKGYLNIVLIDIVDKFSMLMNDKTVIIPNTPGK